jgi:hypothetical protein
VREGEDGDIGVRDGIRSTREEDKLVADSSISVLCCDRKAGVLEEQSKVKM